MVGMLWRDNRVVTLLSTNTQPDEREVIQRRQPVGSRVDVPCPTAVARYQRYMGGVDRNDQLRQYYSVRTKLYKYIFWFLFEASITNAYILHTNYSGAKHQALKEFRLELAKSLIGDYHSKKPHNRHSTPPTNLSLLHFPAKQKKEASTSTRSRCWYCWHKRDNTRRDTQWYCHDCQVHLCHTGDPNTDCYLQYHKQL